MESRGGLQLNDEEFRTFMKGERSGDRLLSCEEGMCSMVFII
jgi:hypothetical protein